MANGLLKPGPDSRLEDIFRIFQEPFPVYTPDPNLSDELNLYLANKELEARDSGSYAKHGLPHGPLENWRESTKKGVRKSQDWSLSPSVPMERNIPVHENMKMAALLNDPTLPPSGYDPSIPVPAGFPSQLETLVASRPEIPQGRSTSGDPLQALRQGSRMRPIGKLETDIPRYQAPTIPIPRTEPGPQDNTVVSTPAQPRVQQRPQQGPQQRVQQRPQQADPLADYNAVMNRKPGFFQENAPLILGLLGGVSGLLEASGPSRVPVSGGQVFARGLQSGLKGYMGGLDYQKGMRKSQQEEAGNILDAVAWREKFQNAELKRQQRVNLGNSILEGLGRLDMDTLTPDMKWRVRMAETLVNSGSIESAWQVFSKIAASPEAQPSLMKMGDNTLLRVIPQKEGPPRVDELWKDKADPTSTQEYFFKGADILKGRPGLEGTIDPTSTYIAEYDEKGRIKNYKEFDLTDRPATSSPSFMTGEEVLKQYPNLSGSINPNQNYRPEYDKEGQIINFAEFDLTEETPSTAELMGDIAKGEGAVAKRYRNEAKDYFSIADSFKKVKAAAMEESPAGDIALIFAYMKMLDPGSVVREGEFATAQNTGSVSERVYVLYNKLLKGDRLTTSQRQMFMKSANTVLESQRDRSENLMSHYTKISNDYGYKVDRVVRDPFEGIEQIIIQGTEPPPDDPFKRKSTQKLKFGRAK